MRNELLDTYHRATFHKTEELIRQFQETKARIAPNIVMDEIFHVEELKIALDTCEAEKHKLVEAIHAAFNRHSGWDKSHSIDQLVADIKYLKKLATGDLSELKEIKELATDVALWWRGEEPRDCKDFSASERLEKLTTRILGGK